MKKVLLVTGGSSGIGAAIAQLASAKGYTVCINYRQNESAAMELVSGITKAGGKAFVFQADVSVESEVEQLFCHIDAQAGRITALVNNAAIIEPQQHLVDMTPGRLRRVFGTNVFGVFFCAREAIRRMSTKNGGSGGSIVNILSTASKYGSPFEYIDYAATKGAVDTFTIGLAKEVAGDHIRVNAVRPGIINTRIHGLAGEEHRVERLKEQIPMKRGGQPGEVANAVLWLLSDEASYVTGSILDVAGGR